MFSFASKVLNTLIGDEEQQQQQQNAQDGRPGGMPSSSMGSHSMPYRPQHPQGVPMRPGMSGPGAPGHGGPPFMTPFSSHGDTGPPSSQFRYGAPLMPTPQKMSSGSSFGSFQQQRPLRPNPGMGAPLPSRFGITPAPDEPDLSHLSEEERALIQNVMAKAKEVDGGNPPPPSMMPAQPPLMSSNQRMFTPGMPSVRPEPMQQQYQHEPQRVHQQPPHFQDQNEEHRRPRDYQQSLPDQRPYNSQPHQPLQPLQQHQQNQPPLQQQPQHSILNKDWNDKPFERSPLNNQAQQSKLYSEQFHETNNVQTSSQQYPTKTLTSTYSSQSSQQTSFKTSQPSWSQQPDSFSEQPPHVSSYQDGSSQKITPLSSSGFYSQPSSTMKSQLTSESSDSSLLSSMSWDSAKDSHLALKPDKNLDMMSDHDSDYNMKPLPSTSSDSYKPSSDEGSFSEGRSQSYSTDSSTLKDTSGLASTSQSYTMKESKPSILEPVYDHSPGEVYTIPEEEEEVTSPIASDCVTSLRKTRMSTGNFRKEELQGRYQDKFSASYASHSPLSSLSSDHRPISSYIDSSTPSTTTSSGFSSANSLSEISQLSSSLNSRTEKLRSLDYQPTWSSSRTTEKSSILDSDRPLDSVGYRSKTDAQQSNHLDSQKSYLPHSSPQHTYQYDKLDQRDSQNLKKSLDNQSDQLQGSQYSFNQSAQQTKLKQYQSNEMDSNFQQMPSEIARQPLARLQQNEQNRDVKSLREQEQRFSYEQESQQQLQRQQQQQQLQQQQQQAQQLQQRQLQQQQQQHQLQQQQLQQQQLQQQQQHQYQQQQQHQFQQQQQQQQQQHNQQQLQHQQYPYQQESQQMPQQQQYQQQAKYQTHQQQQPQQQQFQQQQPHQLHQSYPQSNQRESELMQQQWFEGDRTKHPHDYSGRDPMGRNLQNQDGYMNETQLPQKAYGDTANYLMSKLKSRSPEHQRMGVEENFKPGTVGFRQQNSASPKKFPTKQDQQAQQQASQNEKQTSGTISGMIADFSRALGLGSSTQQAGGQPNGKPTDHRNEMLYHDEHYPKDPYEYDSPEQLMHPSYRANQIKQTEAQLNEFYRLDDEQMAQTHPNQIARMQQLLLEQQQLQRQQIQHEQQQLQMLSKQQQQQQAQLQQAAQQQADQSFLLANQSRLTPQQQKMYQQHMQQQHYANHLRKISRTLPPQYANAVPLKSPQKRDNSVSVASMNQAIALQRLNQAQILGQQAILNNQILLANAASLDSSKLSQARLNVPGAPSLLVTDGATIVTPNITPVGTPRGLRDAGGDSSDTLSETDSQKSLRLRRKLPSIPADQDIVSLQIHRNKENQKSKKGQSRIRSYSPLRQFDGGGYLHSGRSSNLISQRPSCSETNLHKSCAGIDPTPRPGSALGLLQASSVINSTGTKVSFDFPNQTNEIASCLPPDLRHLLESYKDYSYKQSSLKPRHSSLDAGDIHSASESRLLSGLSSVDSHLNRISLQNSKNRLSAVRRKAGLSDWGASRKLKFHRRQLSDPKIYLDYDYERDSEPFQSKYNRAYGKYMHPSLRPPFKSYEYESLDDGLKRSELDISDYAMAGGALRETAINSVLDNDPYYSDRYDTRRYSDCIDSTRRLMFEKNQKSHSWQPSPYASDEEEDQYSREERKARIKAEIARRRQQIEENARLHEELLKLARLRESVELGHKSTSGLSSLKSNPVLSSSYANSHILGSVDDLLINSSKQDKKYLSPRRTAEDRSMDKIASTFRTDDYTSNVYERLFDFSPLTDYTPHAMPLLPDMPTRSRKLLEDLGSSPFTESVLNNIQKSSYSPS